MSHKVLYMVLILFYLATITSGQNQDNKLQIQEQNSESREVTSGEDKSGKICQELAKSPSDKATLKRLKTFIDTISDDKEKTRLMTIYCLGCGYTGQLPEFMSTKTALEKINATDPVVKYLSSDNISDICSTCKGNGKSESPCSRCKGAGKCITCNGSGRQKEQKMGSLSTSGKCMICIGAGKCKECSGTGNLPSKCSKCLGNGKVLSKEKMEKNYLALLGKNSKGDSVSLNTKPSINESAVSMKESTTFQKESARNNKASAAYESERLENYLMDARKLISASRSSYYRGNPQHPPISFMVRFERIYDSMAKRNGFKELEYDRKIDELRSELQDIDKINIPLLDIYEKAPTISDGLSNENLRSAKEALSLLDLSKASSNIVVDIKKMIGDYDKELERRNKAGAVSKAQIAKYNNIVEKYRSGRAKNISLDKVRMEPEKYRNQKLKSHVQIEPAGGIDVAIRHWTDVTGDQQPAITSEDISEKTLKIWETKGKVQENIYIEYVIDDNDTWYVLDLNME